MSLIEDAKVFLVIVGIVILLIAIITPLETRWFHVRLTNTQRYMMAALGSIVTIVPLSMLATPDRQDVFDGAIILSSVACPDGFQNVTEDYSDSYLVADARTRRGDIQVLEGTGSHTHDDGTHGHSVSGKVDKDSINTTHHGDINKKAIKEDSGLSVSGDAARRPHNHEGGNHQHSRIGLLLCRDAIERG